MQSARVIAMRRDADETSALPPPPYSAEAEQSVLGGLLLDASALERVEGTLRAADFFEHSHRLIYEAILSLVADGAPVDVITVFEMLQRREQADECGGLPYLTALSQSVPSASNIRRYAEIVAERSTLRQIIALSDTMASAARQTSRPATVLLDEARQAFSRLEIDRKLGSGRLPLWSMSEAEQQATTQEWLVKGIVPDGVVSIMFGASGTFKSFIAADLALHVANGMPWMGRRTKQGAVLYVAAEGGKGLGLRLTAWRKQRGIRSTEAPLYVMPAAVDMRTQAWRVVESAQAAGVTPRLVIVDTLSQTYSGDENAAPEMAAYFGELGRRFRDLWGCAVLVLHHTGHNATERPRGSTAIQANTSALLGVFRDEKEMLATLACVHMKDGATFADATFALAEVELAKDKDGDPVTSLVARHLSSAEELGEAMDAEAKAGRGGNNQTLLRLLQNGMRETELRKAFYDEIGLDNADSRRQAYHRARAWGIRAGFFEVAQGVVVTLKARNVP